MSLSTQMVSVRVSDAESSAVVLTPAAIDFVAGLQRRFGARRDALLAARPARHAAIAAGGWEGAQFLQSTASVREDPDWRVAVAPPALVDRRVEITGPTERKMTINALNSGAKVWLADLEDANTPHWHNVVSGQVNLHAAARNEISFTSPEGREYRLRDDVELPVIIVRPRGWHLDERNIQIDGSPAVAALVDFGLHFFHNAQELLDRGRGPFFYLPKLESHQEARLWADVFQHAEDTLGVASGSVRATVLIETVPAALEMEEILYELRAYASGLNAGRWDYLFSLIKVFRSSGAGYLLADRAAVTMTAPFMRAYTELLVSTCHRRGAFAIGGMAAFIPSRRDPSVNSVAMGKVHADKQREANDGFDGSWVAHPDLVPICVEEFGAVLGERPNQLERRRDDVRVAPADLLRIPHVAGECTEAGLRNDVEVSLRYIAAWLGGNGAVAINNLMEDAATAEISRAQVWQWVHNHVVLDTGETVTRQLVERLMGDELAVAHEQASTEAENERLDQAATLFVQVALADDFVDFLTLPAYELIE